MKTTDGDKNSEADESEIGVRAISGASLKLCVIDVLSRTWEPQQGLLLVLKCELTEHI